MDNVDVTNATRVEIDLADVKEFARAALEASGRKYVGAELSIAFVGDRRMQTLNEKWRSKIGPTDVLSFSMDDEPGASGPFMLGDVVIASRQATADAAEEGVSLEDKLRELIIHGLLHLMGYDHEESDEAARRMQRRRKWLLKKMGAPNIK